MTFPGYGTQSSSYRSKSIQWCSNAVQATVILITEFCFCSTRYLSQNEGSVEQKACSTLLGSPECNNTLIFGSRPDFQTDTLYYDDQCRELDPRPLVLRSQHHCNEAIPRTLILHGADTTVLLFTTVTLASFTTCRFMQLILKPYTLSQYCRCALLSSGSASADRYIVHESGSTRPSG